MEYPMQVETPSQRAALGEPGQWPSHRTSILDWLMIETRNERFIDNIFVDLCQRLREAGVPVARATGLRRLTAEDYVEIQQLVVSYPYALDTAANNGFDYADLFSPDGEFIRPPTKGRDNLAKLALDQPHGANYVRHYLANQLIEPTADGAIGKQYLVVIDVGESGKPSSLFLGGHYEDVYAKTDAGWKFKRREFIPSRKTP
jgi:hypothetical protein